MENTINLKDEATLKGEYELLKKSHPKVDQVVVNLDGDDETQVCNIFVKYPTRAEYNNIMKLYNIEVINAIEAWVKYCYIGGDPLEVILSNDYALRSLDYAMSSILYVRQSVLKKN